MACSVLLRQPTGQRVSKIRKQQIFFQFCQSYSYVNRKDESLVSSNSNSKQLRFHGVHGVYGVYGNLAINRNNLPIYYLNLSNATPLKKNFSYENIFIITRKKNWWEWHHSFLHSRPHEMVILVLPLISLHWLNIVHIHLGASINDVGPFIQIYDPPPSPCRLSSRCPRLRLLNRLM